MSSVQPVQHPEEAPFFGAPPVRQHVHVTEGMAVNGKRVILSDEDGFWYDNRAVGPPFRDHEGILMVWVISEADWYDWMATAPGTMLPYDKAQCWPATLVYID